MGLTVVTLYTPPGYWRSYPILIAAKYSGAQITVVPSFPGFKGEDGCETDGFLSAFPLRKVPAFEENGFWIQGASAIADYVGNSILRGMCPKDQALVQQWVNFAEGEIAPSMATWVYPAMGVATYSEKASQKAKEALLGILSFLDQYLLQHTFLVCRDVTLADISVACALLLLFTQVMDPSMRQVYPNVTRWFSTCVHQPEFLAVLGDVKLCETVAPGKLEAIPETSEDPQPEEVRVEVEEQQQQQVEVQKQVKQQPQVVEVHEEQPQVVEVHEEQPQVVVEGQKQPQVVALEEQKQPHVEEAKEGQQQEQPQVEKLPVVVEEQKQPQVAAQEEQQQEEQQQKQPEAEDGLDATEEALAAEPKAKDPFASLPKSSFVLDEFKRTYSNEDTLQVALPYLWEKLDPEGWSLWYCEYKYPDELRQVFMSCNLITGMFQRLDRLRKHAFASMALLGVDGDSSISGVWLLRGQGLPFELCEDWKADYESYSWRKLAPDSEETRTLVREYLSWQGDFKHVGKPFNQAKIFK